MFLLLQDGAVPVTDKIFPWFVETALVRVEMEGLQDSLKGTELRVMALPQAVGSEVDRVMLEPSRSLDKTRLELANLTGQLQKSALVQGAISRSGWRGMMAAMEAIFSQQNLMVVVGAIAIVSTCFGGWLGWQSGTGNRMIMEYNDGVIELCYKRFLPKKGKKKWFSCPGFQLPRRR